MTDSHTISPTGPRGGRPLVEDALALRVADLRTGDGLAAYHRLAAADGTVVRVRVETVADGHAWVHVEHHPPSVSWPASPYAVALIALPQRIGRRWWLVCPVTGERAAALYLPAGAERFASRRAHGLAHASQRCRAPARAALRAGKIRMALGGGEPQRPAGMHAATFARQVARLAEFDAAAAG